LATQKAQAARRTEILENKRKEDQQKKDDAQRKEKADRLKA